MVKITENKLIIEIETGYPCELLLELQESMIKLMQLKDASQYSDTLEMHYALQILRELLPTSKDYERAFRGANNMTN